MSSSTVLGGEVTDRAAGVALVADHGDRAVTLDAGEHPPRDLALVNLRRREFRGAWSAVRGEQGVQPQPVEESPVAGAIAVVGGVSQGVWEAVVVAAFDRLPRSRAPDRG